MTMQADIDDPQDDPKRPSVLRQGGWAADLANHLSLHREPDAVRMLIKLTTERRLPRSHGLRNAIVDACGADVMDRLAQACAKFECPYCQDGVVTCERCEGEGRADDGSWCRACLTLGNIACAFCGGSGLATYDFFPLGIQGSVIHTRTLLTIDQLLDVLESPLPSPTPANAASLVGALMARTKQLSRIRSVLRNSLEAARGEVDHHPEDRGILAKLALRSWRALCRTELELARALNALADAFSSTASPPIAGGGGDRKSIEERDAILNEEACRMEASASDMIRRLKPHG